MTDIDTSKTRLAIPILSVLTLIGTVGAGAWTLRGMHADIKGQIDGQAMRSDVRWEQVDAKLSDITVRVQALLNDHDGFVRRSDIRALLRQMRELNDGSGLRVPEFE